MKAERQDDSGPILVPLDFSEHARVILEHAARIARGQGSSLLILHVVHDPFSSPGFYAKGAKKKKRKLVKTMVAGADEMMADFMKAVQADHPDDPLFEDAEVLLVTGVPVNRILEVAKERAVSMIIMGSVGRSAIANLLLGSIAVRVVQLAPVPVMIVKPEGRQGDEKGGDEGS